MRVLFDTSVLVAAIVEPHPQHSGAISWLRRAKAGEVEFLVSSHSLAELYSVLSSLPARPRISPAAAWQLIEENVAGSAQLISISAADYAATVQRVASLGLAGGVIYDALIACAAKTAGADRLLTLNAKDFRRVWPEGESILLTP